MVKNFMYYLLLLLPGIFFLNSCDKEKKASEEIDVSVQWQIDPIGIVIAAPVPDQWNSKIFSVAELNLFTSMDTTSLTGTMAPDFVRDTMNYPFPNPFSDTHMLAFKFNDTFSGEFVLKYVIADNHLNAIETKVVRLKANSGYAAVAITPDLLPGKYRLYYTLSSQSDPHFYKTWGNIQKE